MNLTGPVRLALRVAWASLLIVFGAYVLVVVAGVGGRAVEEAFSK